jgi:hypothetical protein
MGDDSWFYVAVIGGGILTAALAIAALFVK